MFILTSVHFSIINHKFLPVVPDYNVLHSLMAIHLFLFYGPEFFG